jgi:hypothetical protein
MQRSAEPKRNKQSLPLLPQARDRAAGPQGAMFSAKHVQRYRQDLLREGESKARGSEAGQVLFGLALVPDVSPSKPLQRPLILIIHDTCTRDSPRKGEN